MLHKQPCTEPAPLRWGKIQIMIFFPLPPPLDEPEVDEVRRSDVLAANEQGRKTLLPDPRAHNPLVRVFQGER